MKIPNLTRLYGWFGGFGQFMCVVPLVAIIVLAAVNRLTDSFAAALVAIGGSGVVHDQMDRYNNRRDRAEQKVQPIGNQAHP